MDVYVIQLHACNGRMDGMCPGVGGASSLKGTYVLVGGSAWLCGSHATVASDPHRYNGCIVVCCCQACVGIYTPPTLSPTPHYSWCDSTHHTYPPGDISTHTVQGGNHPNAWTRGGGMWHLLLSLAVVAVAGGVYDVQDWELVPHSAPWGPRVHVRTRPEDPATHRATPAMLGRGGDHGWPSLFFAPRVFGGWDNRIIT